jgi:hypothetical protein
MFVSATNASFPPFVAKSACGPLLPLSPRSFAAVQLPDCGHSFGVRHLDDGLAAVGKKPDIRVSRASRIQSGE